MTDKTDADTLIRGPQPIESILGITPYKGGEALKDGWKLSSNENPLGCSEAAKAAVRAAADALEIYPEGSARLLREKIAKKYGIDVDRIVCGAGSDEIFQLLGRAYLRPGDEIIQTEHGFLVYHLVAQQSGAVTIKAPEKAYTADVDAILERITGKTRIVFLANPNNPTGTYIPYEEVKRLHKGLREDILLVLDGAYAEYVRNNDYSGGMELAGQAPNVVVTRTFSKIYGLAALRLGWAYGPESVIDAIHRVRGPFNVNALAQAAGLASIEDESFVDRSIGHNQAELDRMRPSLGAMGYEVTPSVCNFLLVHFGADKKHTAEKADKFLRARGIVVRGMAAYGLPEALRVSIGVEAANDAVLAALEDFARAG